MGQREKSTVCMCDQEINLKGFSTENEGKARPPKLRFSDLFPVRLEV